MNGAKFGIVEAVKKAWTFTVDNRGYLMRIGFIPLVLQVATVLFVATFRAETNVFEDFIWSLPANLFFSWFMFAEARFLLLGERLDRLPDDSGYLAARSLAMKRAVVILLLFDMGLRVAFGWVEWMGRSGLIQTNMLAGLSIPLVYAVLFWSLRFSVLHIVAAVEYPVQDFLERVRGFEFSARMAGMIALCSLPVYVVFALFVVLVFAGGAEATDLRISVLQVVQVPATMLVSVLLNAAAAFALKEVLGRERGAEA